MADNVIGIISDTHGLLRSEAIQALTGSNLIIHAGDIGRAEVIEEMQKIAPVVAVRGNTDKGEWANMLPLYEVVEFHGLCLYIIHDLLQMNIEPAAAGINIVISGHSHSPSERREKGVLYLNPGSAGPRRFNLPVCLAKIVQRGEQSKVEFIAL